MPHKIYPNEPKEPAVCTKGTIANTLGLEDLTRTKMSRNVIILTSNLRRNQRSRNIINMALAMTYQGHRVRIITSEIEDNLWETELTKLKVKVISSYLPQSFFGFWKAHFKVAKTILMAFWATTFSTGKLCPTVVLNDTCAISIPVLKLFGYFKVIYFQYFFQLENLPGQRYLLSITPTKLQQWAMKYADEVVVQNYATGKIFTNVFGMIKMPKILYPCIDIGVMEREECLSVSNINHELSLDNNQFFLITGPYHPRSNFELAVEAFDLLYVRLSKKNQRKLPMLVIAGKFNELDDLQRKYLSKLVEKASVLLSSPNIVILKKFTTITKKTLLTYCIAVLHTTCQEIFGNQILEAMYMGRPVIACNDGGVAAELLNDNCGVLVKPTAYCFASIMNNMFKDKDLCDMLGLEAKRQFRANFSFTKYAAILNLYVERAIPKKKKFCPLSGMNCEPELDTKISEVGPIIPSVTV